MGKQDRAPNLAIERTGDIPLREVSGLCLAHIGGEHRVMAIGDSTTRLAHAVIADRLDWAMVELTEVLRDLDEDDPQLEGITADGAGRVLLLQEGPARAVAVDTADGRRTCVIHLEVPTDDDLGRSWRDDGTSRGEAIALLREGHVLVAKEKRPPALIEFGPPGDAVLGLSPSSLLPHDGSFQLPAEGEVTYSALAVWPLGDEAGQVFDDISDAAIGPDGRLYLLSDQSAAIARVAVPADGDDQVRFEAWWRIDGSPEKAEGLTILPDGRAVVALDRKRQRENLLLLDTVTD